MSDGVVVRRAVPGDAGELVALARAVVAEPQGWLIAEDAWRDAGEERRYLKALRGHPHAAVFVAVVGDEVVGRLSVSRDPHPASSHVADLGLMVAAGHRRRGVGTALLDQAVAWARESDVTKLELHVFPHNAPAISLYEQYGFEQEGYRRHHYRRGGGYVDAILMALRVRSARDGAGSSRPP